MTYLSNIILNILMKPVLQITVGVFLGNILTLCVLVALEPYVKVERRVVTNFFRS